MFTGIIQELGTVSRVERTKGLVRVTIQAPKTAARIQRLESVAVNGVCLSVVQVRDDALTFELIPETQRVTTLRRMRAGKRVNLEPSLRLADRLNGHLVFGHIDGMGTVIKRLTRFGELILEIRVPSDLRKFMVTKGSVAMEGVSLTIGRVRASTFRVHLIPETVRQTTLSQLTTGDVVNLEVDYVAKLVFEFQRGSRG